MKCSRRPCHDSATKNEKPAFTDPRTPIVRDTDAASESTKRLFFRVAEKGRGREESARIFTSFATAIDTRLLTRFERDYLARLTRLTFELARVTSGLIYAREKQHNDEGRRRGGSGRGRGECN